MSAHHCGPFFPTGKQDRQARGNTDLYITYREKENRKGGLWARPTFGLGLEGRARGKVPELATSYRPWRADHRDNEALARLAEKLRPLLEKANPTMPPTLPSSLGLLYTLRHLVVPAEGACWTTPVTIISNPHVVSWPFAPSFTQVPVLPLARKSTKGCNATIYFSRGYIAHLFKRLSQLISCCKNCQVHFSFLSVTFFWNSNCAYSPRLISKLPSQYKITMPHSVHSNSNTMRSSKRASVNTQSTAHSGSIHQALPPVAINSVPAAQATPPQRSPMLDNWMNSRSTDVSISERLAQAAMR